MLHENIICPKCGSNEGIYFRYHMYDIDKKNIDSVERSFLRYNEYMCIYCVLNFGAPIEIKCNQSFKQIGGDMKWYKK